MDNTENDVLTIINGIVTKCKKDAVNVVIPDGVTKIYEDAFNRCTLLESVFIPEGVEKIESSAFFKCTSLKYIEIPSTLKHLHKKAFEGCGAVEKIVSHSLLYPFDEKTRKLYDATESRKKTILVLQAAKEEAKRNKIVQIQNATANAVLESIVSAHKSKASFVRNGSSSYLRINAGKGGIEIYLSDSDLSKWMKTLPALLDFAESSSDAATLRKYALDNGFKDASQKYFSLRKGCVNGNDNKNPVYLFIGDGAKTIRENAFEKCKWLKSVVIGSGLRKIEDYAFSHCIDLVSVEIPETVTEIGDFAFFCCYSLETILFGGTVAQWKALTEKKENLLVYSPLKSVKCSDGECGKPVYLVAEYNGKKPQGVSLGYDATKIPEDFFTEQKSLIYVQVPEGITEIGARAFKNCDVQNVLLPLTLTKIDDSAFEGCKALSLIWFYGSEKLWSAIEKGEDWCKGIKAKNIECFGQDSLIIENGVLIECKKDADVVRLPKGTAKICNGAFKDCVCLKHVAFYSGMTEIGNHAFLNCTSLDTIVFEGTRKEWEEIKKGSDWNKNVPAKVVHCKDYNAKL